MSHDPEHETPDFTIVTIRGRTLRIAPDHRQPGAVAREQSRSSLFGAFVRSASEMRVRDASQE